MDFQKENKNNFPWGFMPSENKEWPNCSQSMLEYVIVDWGSGYVQESMYVSFQSAFVDKLIRATSVINTTSASNNTRHRTCSKPINIWRNKVQ